METAEDYIFSTNAGTAYRKVPKHKIVTTFSYLCGLKEEDFARSAAYCEKEIFEALKRNKQARIVRNLCLLRSEIFRFYGKAKRGYEINRSSPLRVTEESMKAFEALCTDRVKLHTGAKVSPMDLLVEINGQISNKVPLCRELFPDWITWDHIKDLLVIPRGNSVSGIKAELQKFSHLRKEYPFQTYIHWKPVEDIGNILYNDRKFVELAYSQARDRLRPEDYSKLEDTPACVRNRIETFIDDADKLAILVDCENSDPFALHNALMSFSEETKRKINRIVLIRDDTYTVSAWKMFQSISTDIEVEDICVTRLKTTKSLTDVKLCAAAFNLYYEQGVKSFVLASSDSDYFGLIDSLPDDAQFCVFAQRNKTAGVFKEALTNLQIPYCYIEDFFGDNSGELMKRAVRKELRIRISEISFNTLDLLRSSARAAGAKPSEEELTNMLNDAIADLQLTFDKTSGIARIVDRTEVRAG